jgi:1,4-dihydroxy-2-naphthoyl-CoA hydrolase
MYEYKTTVKLHETDAAGILFFSHQFKLLHDAYEALLEKMGLGFAILIRERPYFLPIVHASSDYKAPLFVGDRLTIQVVVQHIGTTSFTFSYRILNDQRNIVGTGKTVHVTINKKTRQKIPLPAEMREAITQLKTNQTQ